MYSIGQMVNEFKISRSTLLYYDKIGLLSPSSRTESNYRKYSEKDFDKMIRIESYKKAGVSLSDIQALLNSKSESAKILELRLEKINEEISLLRKQQVEITTLLSNKKISKKSKSMNKDQWVKILSDSGMSEEDMMNWHKSFEASLPEAHTDFLESLGIGKLEIRRIKKMSK